jgi:hypothetical protein
MHLLNSHWIMFSGMMWFNVTAVGCMAAAVHPSGRDCFAGAVGSGFRV